MQMSSRFVIVSAIVSLLPRRPLHRQPRTGTDVIPIRESRTNGAETAGAKMEQRAGCRGAAARLALAQQNSLSHQFPGEPDLAGRVAQAGARFSTIAENIAEGPSVVSIHEQWMKSPPHRRNLLDPQLDSVGISVAERNGTWFAVEDFSLAVGALSCRIRRGWWLLSSNRADCVC